MGTYEQDLVLDCAIEEAFAGDFNSLKERYNLDDTDLEQLKTQRRNNFELFEFYIKRLIALSKVGPE